ncbi:hypothetical protein MMC26_001762 [Xylographa opegraphella]|nr:hypothetical protein [Xylographa opegraphella]
MVSYPATPGAEPGNHRLIGFTPVNQPTARQVPDELHNQALQTPDQRTQRRELPLKRGADQLTPPPSTAKKLKRERSKQPKKVKNKENNALHDLPCEFAASDFTEASERFGTEHQLAPAGVVFDDRSELKYVGLSSTTTARLASFRYQGEPQMELPQSGFLPSSGQGSKPGCEIALDRHDARKEILSHDSLEFEYNPFLEDTVEHNIAIDTPCSKLGKLHTTTSFDPTFGEILEDYANAESEDEFPIDEQDAQCLLQISTIEEGFEPPSSLRIPFDDNSQTNEIYDPHLQHSRPSSSRSLRSIHFDGITIPVGNRTTIDKYRFSKNHSSQVLGRSSPCPNGGDENEANSDLTGRDENLLDDVDSDFFELETETSEKPPNAPMKLALDIELPKLQWNPSTMYKPAKFLPSPESAPIPNEIAESQRLPLAEISAQSRPPLPAPHGLGFDSEGNALPFARPLFPSLVLDRSPILGVSSSAFLRTCFRIGEALNVATQASHTGTHPLIELYARVTYSHRVGVEQFIQFADLFRSQKPPFLNGSFVGWKSVDLWDNDSKAFLGDTGKGKIARCVGRMKRDETARGWKIMVLSIWEADWEDVAYVKGIVCS